jgi:hypothetical protein
VQPVQPPPTRRGVTWSLFGRRRKETGAESPDHNFLLTRPAPDRSSVFRGAQLVDHVALLRWDSTYGPVDLGYSVTGDDDATMFVEALRGRYNYQVLDSYACVVAVRVNWDMYGPKLEALDIHHDADVLRPYQPTWRQLATILGTKVPYWHSTLRDPDTILEWRPGAPPAIVPAFYPELPTAALTMLAADEPDGSHVAEVCWWLARTVRQRATNDALQYIDDVIVRSQDVTQWWTLGAIPAKMQRPKPTPLPDVIRRAGWSQLMDRRDTLAAKVAHLARMWDAGAEWPAGATAHVQPYRCPTAAEWAARLVPVAGDLPPTVLEQDLLTSVKERGDTGEVLEDPQTGLPAVYCNRHTRKEYIATPVPQRLPTTSALASVTLSVNTVWVRTEDGRLWIAPRHPGHGLNWGYRGAGPTALATLVSRLLKDITAQAVDDPKHMTIPRGLLRLIQGTPQEGSTTYTRQQLEGARDGV